MSTAVSDDVVALLVRHRVRHGKDAEYERWLRRIIATASAYPGHLGIDVVRDKDQGLHQFTCILRFASTALLQNWLDSQARRDLVDEIRPLLVDGDQIETHAQREFWFTPAECGPKPPLRWKQACVTYLVILPHTLLVPLIWQPVFTAVPWLGGYVAATALITVTIVLSVVYVFMPPATRLFEGWLNRR